MFAPLSDKLPSPQQDGLFKVVNLIPFLGLTFITNIRCFSMTQATKNWLTRDMQLQPLDRLPRGLYLSIVIRVNPALMYTASIWAPGSCINMAPHVHVDTKRVSINHDVITDDNSLGTPNLKQPLRACIPEAYYNGLDSKLFCCQRDHILRVKESRRLFCLSNIQLSEGKQKKS